MRKIWTKIEDNKLTEIYGDSTKEYLINTFTGRSYDSIKIRAAKLGLKKTINVRIKSNLSVLLKDTPEVYYWIGFLMADGYINHDTLRLKLSLAEIDKLQVEKFSKFIGCDSILESNRNGKKYFDITAQDKSIIPKIIKKYNFKPRKTYNPPNLKYLESNFDLFCSFLIGFIDADGSINKSEEKKNTCITIRCHNSWGKTLEYLQNILLSYFNLENKTVKYYRKDKLATIYFNNFEIIKFLKIKQNVLSLPVINRKWDKIDENFISRGERFKKNTSDIKKLIIKKHSIKEISNIVGLTYSRTHKIIKDLLKENIK